MNFHHNTISYSLVLCVGVLLTACEKTEKPVAKQTAEAPAAPAKPAFPVANVTALKMEDLTVGTGTEAGTGNKVTVHYTGWLTDGTKFDSSKDHGMAFEFQIGAGEVIKGWDQGVSGMKAGGARRLTIPPSLGYGAAGAGGVIPPNATLVFDVELLNVK
jgi:FKBP-type peptidyl-prolyl cis-trans isomerase